MADQRLAIVDQLLHEGQAMAQSIFLIKLLNSTQK